MPIEKITWEPKLVKLAELRENLSNPKVINDEGRLRLHKSLSKFGIAGTMVVNTDMTIIDGHSRKQDLLDTGVTEVWVSMPNRLLTDDEYKEMNAVFDHARASEIDHFIIENTFSEDVINEWDLQSEKKIKKVKVTDENGNESMVEPKYPIIPRYDEKYEAIVIICSNEIDTIFIKNALEIGHEMSYKNKNVRETSIITAAKFIEKWRSKSLSRVEEEQKQ